MINQTLWFGAIALLSVATTGCFVGGGGVLPPADEMAGDTGVITSDGGDAEAGMTPADDGSPGDGAATDPDADMDAGI